MLTREEFQILYDKGPDALFDLFTAMQEQIAFLTARVQELENRLGKDSHNSSKPPSSDGLAKKPVSLRPKSTRNPGGQPGHPGKRLEFSEHPDQIVLHPPAHCQECGTSLEGVEGQVDARRQVYDLPPLKLVVTEHRTQHKCCPNCGLSNLGTFPQEVAAQVGYGPRVKALGVYLIDFQLLPYHRVAQLFADLFDASLAPGTLFLAQQEASSLLESVVTRIKVALKKKAVAHFDETGFRVCGRLHWLHSASTPGLSYYSWHQKRGKIGMDAAGVLPSFVGRAVHDGYASYQGYACRHALCNAHHLRELTALFEQEGARWAEEMRVLLVEIKQAVDQAKEQDQKRLPIFLEAQFEERYQKWIGQGLAENPLSVAVAGKRGRPKQSVARNLLDRLDQHRDQVLAFMYDFAVPFDNNQAERDIRMMKVQQKISGTFRSTEGADAFCRLRSYLGTLQKQGKGLLSALEHVYRGNPLEPDYGG
jgi:transposase